MNKGYQIGKGDFVLQNIYLTLLVSIQSITVKINRLIFCLKRLIRSKMKICKKIFNLSIQNLKLVNFRSSRFIFMILRSAICAERILRR